MYFPLLMDNRTNIHDAQNGKIFRKFVYMVKFINAALFLFAFSCVAGQSQNTQNDADDIVGYYLSIDPFNQKKSQNYIYKISDGAYEGVVTWVEDPTLQQFVGYKFLTGLTFNKRENEWQNGELKYPGKSGTFKTYMSFPNGLQTLKVRGYLGVSLFGKTVYWTRENRR
jgi:uncharacterized protein (DUF2147 family)